MRSQVRVLYNGEAVALRCAPGRETCTLAEFKAMVGPYCVANLARESIPTDEGGAEASNSGFNAQQE